MNLFTWSLRALFIVTLLLASQAALATIRIEQVTPASSSSACDGSIRLTAKGDDPERTAGPFSVQVFGPTPSSRSGVEGEIIISELCTGDYQVEITDRFGCKRTITTAIPLCGFMIDGIVGSTCTSISGGNIGVLINGGTEPYTYQWKNKQGNPPAPSQIFFGGQVVGNLPANEYCVTVTDANNCMATKCFSTAPTEGEATYPYIQSVNVYAVVNEVEYLIYSGNWEKQADNCLKFNGGMEEIASMAYNAILAGQAKIRIRATASKVMSSLSISLPGIFAYNPTATSTDNKQWEFDYQANQLANIVANGNIYFPIEFTGVANGKTILDLRSASANLTQCAPLPQLSEQCTWSPTPQTGTDDVHVVNLCQSSAAFSVSIQEINYQCNINLADVCLQIDEGGRNYNFLWADGSTGGCKGNLAVGQNYSVTVTDKCGQNKIVNVNIPATSSTFSVDINDYQSICRPYGKGMVELKVSGGTRPYTYQWNGPNYSNFTTVPKIGNLTEGGDFKVTVTDHCNRRKVYQFYMRDNGPIQITLNKNIPACTDDGIGSVIGISTNRGGTPMWSNGIAGHTIKDVSPGKYTVTVEEWGCSYSETFTVSKSETHPSVIISLAESLIPCTNDGVGSLKVKATGTDPFTYRWSDNNGIQIGTANQIQNVSIGAYTVTVTDDRGCKNSKDFFIQNAPVDISIEERKHVCEGETKELYVKMPSGAFTYPPFNAYWANSGSTFNDISVNAGMISSWNALPAGNYSVTVTDARGCQGTDDIVLEQGSGINYIAGVIENISCLSEFYIDIPDARKYTYKWSNGASTKFSGQGRAYIDNLPLGNYCVTITEDRDCENTICRTIITGIPKIVVEQVTQNQPPQNNGAVNISVVGGTAPYTYRWRNSSGMPVGNVDANGDITGLSPGKYTVSVTDIKGCSAIASVEIEGCVPGGTLSIEIRPEDVVPCAYGAGSISPRITKGKAIFYKWSGPQGFSSNQLAINDLQIEGEYCITVTDCAGNTATNCQYITCNCPNIEFDIAKENECINDGFFGGSLQNGRLEFKGLASDASVLGAYGEAIFNGMNNDDGGFKFTLDWYAGDGDPIPDASFTYGRTGTNYNFTPNDKEKLTINNEGIVNVIIRDFLGCTYSEKYEFYETIKVDATSPQYEDMGTNCQDLSGISVLTHYLDCKKACGPECVKNPKTYELIYKPSSESSPCTEGGVINISRRGIFGSRSIGTITIPNIPNATEIINYNAKTQIGGNCYYDVGCFFPLGSLPNNPEINTAIYVTKGSNGNNLRKKGDDCNQTGHSCGGQSGNPICDGTIITRQLTGGSDCHYEEVCLVKDPITGRIRETVLSRKSEATECIWSVIDAPDEYQCTVYEYCPITKKSKKRQTLRSKEECQQYKICSTKPIALRPDDEAFLIGGDQPEIKSAAFLGKNLTSEKNLINTATIINDEQQQTASKLVVPEQEVKIGAVKVYPNPFKEILNIEYISEEEGVVNIHLLNAIGINTLSQQFNAVKGANKFTIETKSNVSLGVYYLKITDKNGNFSIHKVVH